MITEIVPMASLYEKLLGHQKVNDSIKYRLLKFLLFKPVNKGVLVYNLLTKQMILITNQLYDYITDNKIVYSAALNELIQYWFVVPANFDEFKCFKQLKDFYKSIDNEEYINTFTILPTTKCNARCFYCFENNKKRADMSEQVAIDTAKYIKMESKGKGVLIKWFGGEPLCNTKAINIISNYLSDNNIIFKSNIITNAYLFNSENVELAKNIWNVKKAQITLDGTEKLYNSIKSYIYPSIDSPFKTVIDNINLLSKNGIEVIIRLNFDNYNKSDLYDLIDYLKVNLDTDTNISVYAKLLFDTTGPLQMNRSNDEREKIFEEFGKFEKYIIDNGLFHFQKIGNKIKYEHCSSESSHAVTILPTGDLGLCEFNIDSEMYGNIYDGVTNIELAKEYSIHQPKINDCDNCPIYPICSRLKKCPYYIRKCEKYERNSTIEHIKLYMEYTYKLYTDLSV